METGGKSPLTGRGAGRPGHRDQQSPARHDGRTSPAGRPDANDPSACGRDQQHLEELIQSTPDVRAALVERFRRAIEDGEYEVNAEQLAERILRSSLIER